MQEAIDAAWANPEGAVLRTLLFPQGKPTVEEFIKTVAEYIKNNEQRE